MMIYWHLDDPLNRITLSILLTITFLGSILDVLYISSSNVPLNKLSTCKKIFIAFSVPRNFKSVASAHTTETNLGCLHGIRFLTIGWVVMGHTYALTNHQAFGLYLLFFDTFALHESRRLHSWREIFLSAPDDDLMSGWLLELFLMNHSLKNDFKKLVCRVFSYSVSNSAWW